MIATGGDEGMYMARLSISYSGHNNDKAIEIRDWLAKNGWDDVLP
jgi:hypothetical protein